MSRNVSLLLTKTYNQAKISKLYTQSFYHFILVVQWIYWYVSESKKVSINQYCRKILVQIALINIKSPSIFIKVAWELTFCNINLVLMGIQVLQQYKIFMNNNKHIYNSTMNFSTGWD